MEVLMETKEYRFMKGQSMFRVYHRNVDDFANVSWELIGDIHGDYGKPCTSMAIYELLSSLSQRLNEKAPPDFADGARSFS